MNQRLIGIVFALSLVTNLYSETTLNSSELSKINTKEAGSYLVTYKITDSFGQEVIKTRIVNVVKNELPVITLNGSDNIRVIINNPYVEEGYTANDKEDGDITSNVVVEGYVDSSTIGTYVLTYKVTDSFGNISEIKRTVTVAIPNDINAKEIEPSNLPATHKFNLWEYFVNNSDDNVLVKKYKNNVKMKNQINQIERKSDSEIKIHFPYTTRTIVYSKNNDDTIKMELLKKDNLSEESNFEEFQIIGSNIGTCTLDKHYNKIELDNEVYDDVIKMTCDGDKEAYFAKNKGLVVENILSENTNEEDYSIEEEPNENIEFKTIEYPVKESLTTNNLTSVKISNSFKLQEAPYNLSGKGIKVGVIDGGKINVDHVEFEGRATNDSSNDYEYTSHGTHVAGTISAKGIKKEAKGFAYQSNVVGFSFYNNYFHYGMQAAADQGIFITNHSYGYSSPIYVGEYSNEAKMSDKLVYNNPYIIAVKSAGNDRYNTKEYPHYGNIKGFGNARNVITVGSVNQDETISMFSSVGPVKDGRVKPDLVSKGNYLYSTSIGSNTSYANKAGTSMAAPGVTGLLALMQEEYIKVNNDKMKENIAKGILANTAKDLGRKGPDYEYGFGLINGLEAVKVIDTMNTENTKVQDDVIFEGETKEYTLTLNEQTKFKSTLCWIDNGNTLLSSDLDLTVVDEEGNVKYSYTLNPDKPEELAKQDKLNTVDNVEQLETTLPKGEYTLIISNSKIKYDAEYSDYALISNIPLKYSKTTIGNSPIKEIDKNLMNESVK